MNPARCNRTEDATVFDRLQEDDIRLAAHVQLPVLVTSENHDHRDMCARLIHATGDCVRGPFVKFSSNGNDAGRQYSSVRPASAGNDDAILRQRFDHARGGTLFIDDITMLTVSAQAQLLALLGERLRPRFSTVQLFRPSVRIIAGSSRHLYRERAIRSFCEQLFYRLNVIHVLMHSGGLKGSP